MSSTPDSRRCSLLDDLRLEAAVAVTRHVDLDRADLRQHCLAANTVTGISTVVAGRVALVIAEVVGDLTVEGGFQDPFRELLQQPTVAGQLQARCAGLVHEPSDQLRVYTICRRSCRIDLRHRGSIHGHRHVSHQVLLLDQELHRSLYRPCRWFILSAEHALLSPDQLVAPYERHLPDTPRSYRTAWGLWAVERLALLAGPLDGRVVEVHAGAAYLDAISAPLLAKGAVVVDRLKGMRYGMRLAWYDVQSPGTAEPTVSEPESEVTGVVEQLLGHQTGMSPVQFLASGGAGFKVPGLYSWWVDPSGAEDLSHGLRDTISSGLIYAGLAGATRWPSGGRSTNTLWSRIATMHLGGNHGFSTAWMYEHLTVVAVPCDDADTLGKLEERVLRTIDPPFNLKGMLRTPVRSRITHLRRAHGTAG
jgi:hypothetical protein